MTTDQAKPFIAAAQLLGEQTRAVILIELTHDGNARITANGNLIDVAYCSASLDGYVKEIMQGRQKGTGAKFPG